MGNDADLRTEMQQLKQVKARAESDEQRVLQNLMGETQRKAMLTQIMADMEAMSLRPVGLKRNDEQGQSRPSRRKNGLSRGSSTLSDILQRRAAPISSVGHSPRLRGAKNPHMIAMLPQRRLSTLGSEYDPLEEEDLGLVLEGDDEGPSGDEEREDEDDDELPELRAIRARHRRRLHASPHQAQRPREQRIRWEKSSHVRMAMDIPTKLMAVLGSDSEDDDKVVISPSSPSPSKEQTKTQSSPRPHRTHQKSQYGAWYIPREQWWLLHQAEQQTLDDLHPEDHPPVDHDDDHSHLHCHHAPNQRNHKDPLPQTIGLSPHAAAWHSPRTTRSRETSILLGMSTPRASIPPSVPPLSHPSARINGAPAPERTTAADPITQRTIELQQEIPQSYIAREYRNYILAKGVRLPTYLQEPTQ
ncbi:hypothetical protein Poli38472_009178 [Pythium oligandrum]|uniref:Uncharacterized protein n=1 Tax=Pythium oligandrum TaxID=41045 RepID=A0A8K1FJK0_PYTOL|nr:hypothetical protein Poli38472_009178 [Pythium oligandrum]|eukprot:TMW65011.1 hypothetical protein Poli38472_009178 [Pythium oligandrum]